MDCYIIVSWKTDCYLYLKFIQNANGTFGLCRMINYIKYSKPVTLAFFEKDLIILVTWNKWNLNMEPVVFFIKKKTLVINLVVNVPQREGQRPFNCWFTPQVAHKGQSWAKRKPGTSSRSATWVAGAHALGPPSAVFLRPLAGTLIGNWILES